MQRSVVLLNERKYVTYLLVVRGNSDAISLSNRVEMFFSKRVNKCNCFVNIIKSFPFLHVYFTSTVRIQNKYVFPPKT